MSTTNTKEFRPFNSKQDFQALRKQLLVEKKLFEDPEFTATNSSLYFKDAFSEDLVWVRPKQIVENPQFIVDGISRFDLNQGSVSDCWFISAVSSLTLYDELYNKVVPKDQGFGDDYAGIFYFRFWRYGKWIEVVIDDRLPATKTTDEKTEYTLFFLKSSDPNEFWSALIEKAYAKLQGSYEALSLGEPQEASIDFSGGISESYKLTSLKPEFEKILVTAFQRKSLITCSCMKKEGDTSVGEETLDNGLVQGHAYSVTHLTYVKVEGESVLLIRVRNPWGKTEWKGAWSDNSNEWEKISEEDKKKLQFKKKEDGEFWMTFKDFQTNFTNIDICYLNPDLFNYNEMNAVMKAWDIKETHGEWVRGSSAGGCSTNSTTYPNNPQYRLEVKQPDDGDANSKCTVILSLMQKYRRAMKYTRAKNIAISCDIYSLKDPKAAPVPLNETFFISSGVVPGSPEHSYINEVTSRFKLPVGSYILIPSSFNPDENGQFLLRVYSEKKSTIGNNDVNLAVADYKPRSSGTAPDMKETIAKDRIAKLFDQCAGEDKEVDWKELQQTLNNSMKNDIGPQGFSKEVCRSMIAMLDEDKSGKLGLDEFKLLWEDVIKWKGVFDGSTKGSRKGLSVHDLRPALNSSGLVVNTRIMNLLIHRYSSMDGIIELDDFMMCAIRLKTMINFFKNKCDDCTQETLFTMDEWVENAMYS